jgi:hypothetical protein
MSTPKPRIRPKADPFRQQSETPLHDPSFDPDRDPPVFTERDAGWEPGVGEGVVFHEDDCLR